MIWDKQPASAAAAVARSAGLVAVHAEHPTERGWGRIGALARQQSAQVVPFASGA